MKHIEKMIESIDEELDGAAEYAECYIKSKSRGHSSRAAKYKSMAEDEDGPQGSEKLALYFFCIVDDDE